MTAKDGAERFRWAPPQQMCTWARRYLLAGLARYPSQEEMLSVKPYRDRVGFRFRWRLWWLGVETKPAKVGVVGALAVAALFVLLSGTAVAKPVISLDSSQWTVFNRLQVATGYSTDKAMQAADGGVEFNFPDTASGFYTSLLMAHLSANLTDSTITAVIKVTADSGTTFVFNPQSNPAPNPANVRLVFWTTVGPFANEDYWWSNPASYVLAPGQATLSVPIDPALWSDLNGEFGNRDAAHLAQFAFAAANVKQIGLSFGGGFFFLNGVAVSGGSATFELVSMTLS